MEKGSKSGVFLFFTAGLAFAVLSFFLSVLVFRFSGAVSAAFGLTDTLVVLITVLLISIVLIYICYKFIFKARRILIPLFFSLDAVFTLIFSLIFYFLTYTPSSWSGFIFIFLYIPVIIAIVSWIFFLIYITLKKLFSKTKEA
jgi:hypothetical protein